MFCPTHMLPCVCLSAVQEVHALLLRCCRSCCFHATRSMLLACCPVYACLLYRRCTLWC
jgi:hypothetical protein